MLDLASLDLHDATLASVVFDVQGARCIAELITTAGPAALRWTGVRDVLLPHEEPWGASQSILEARTHPDGVFEIQMQSGDLIRVRARTCAFESRPSVSGA